VQVANEVVYFVSLVKNQARIPIVNEPEPLLGFDLLKAYEATGELGGLKTILSLGG
jgi:hypothetical protein